MLTASPLILDRCYGSARSPVDIALRPLANERADRIDTRRYSADALLRGQVESQILRLEFIEPQVRELVEAQLESLFQRIHLLHELDVLDECREPFSLFFPLEVESMLCHPQLEQVQYWPASK